MTLGGADVAPVRVVRITEDQIGFMEAALSMDAHHFGLRIEHSRYRSLLATCPGALFVAITPTDEVVAYADIFPLEPEALDRFVRGDLMEAELEPSDLISVEELPTRRHVDFYFAGFGAWRPGGAAEARAFLDLRAAVSRSLASVANGGARTISVFAVAASPIGVRLIRTLGGTLVTSGTMRRDGMDCYRLNRLSTGAETNQTLG